MFEFFKFFFLNVKKMSKFEDFSIKTIVVKNKKKKFFKV